MRHKTRVAWRQYLLLISLSILLLAGCDQTSEDIAGEITDQLQEELEQQAQEAQDAAGQWIKDQANSLLEDATQSISEWWQGLDLWQSAQESIGLSTPALVGEVAFARPQLDHDVIKSAFVSAYEQFKLWDSLGEPDSVVSVYGDDLLVQYFNKGDKRSAIVMPDDPDRREHVAFAIPGEWLTKYEAVGGPEAAGYPSSIPEDYDWFWQGKRQTFILPDTGLTYALMKARGQDEIQLLPPDFYEVYRKEDGLSRLGYPLSSFPMNPDAGDEDWIRTHEVDEPTAELLRRWRSQPHQIQIFEKGSLWRDVATGDVEVVEKLALIGRETKLSGEVASAFSQKYTTIQLSSADDCYEETIRHIANAANGDFGSDLLRQVAFLPLESSLAGAGMAYKAASAKLALIVAKYVLTQVKTGSISEANEALVAGLIIDSFYKKAVSDYLSAPLTKITLDLARLSYKPLSDGRLSREMTVEADYGPHRHSTQLDMEVMVNYDPLTHVVSGAMTSESTTCRSATYIFQFRLDEDPDYGSKLILERGDLTVYDLESGKKMP